MANLQKKSNKLENKVGIIALAVCAIGILLAVLGFCYSSIVGITDDDGSDGSSPQGYYGIYHATIPMPAEYDDDCLVTLTISKTNCIFRFDAAIQGTPYSFTDNYTYEYVTSDIAQECEENYKYYGCNGLLLYGNEDAKIFKENAVLWIANEQAGNYHFALYLVGDELLFV